MQVKSAFSTCSNEYLLTWGYFYTSRQKIGDVDASAQVQTFIVHKESDFLSSSQRFPTCNGNREALYTESKKKQSTNIQ